MKDDGDDSQPEARERVTWICCDECGKWRQVAQSLADALDENEKW